MGMNAQSIFGSDPESVAYRMRQQEIQNWMAPYKTTSERGAALVGGALGRGIVNLFNDRGFFESADPGIRAYTDVNRIASQYLSEIDPTDPQSMSTAYAQLAKELASKGYSQPAYMAATEAAKLSASIGAGFKESSTYMTKTNAPALFKNGKYYDAEGKELKTSDLKIIPKDAYGRIIDTVGAGATGAGTETVPQKAAKALSDLKAKAAAAKATKDPLAPQWDDNPKTAAAKAQARAERDAQKAIELSNMGGIGTEMVAP